jgi:hypothetical protein
MSTRNLPGAKKRSAHRNNGLAVICEPMSENVGASNSSNPKGLHSLYRDNVTSFMDFMKYCGIFARSKNCKANIPPLLGNGSANRPLAR